MADCGWTSIRRTAIPGRMRHQRGDNLSRHVHDHAFVAVVLSGRYVEAGDTGLHRLEAGDVLLHRAYESHLNRFDHVAADVLILPAGSMPDGPVLHRVADPDAIARLAVRDQAQACHALNEVMTEHALSVADWPDQLAQALREDPSLVLSDWAASVGLHLGSISRGFRQVFSVTPARYRAIQRAHRATAAIARAASPLCRVAIECGFADQAHMTRAVKELTGLSPLAFRSPD